MANAEPIQRGMSAFLMAFGAEIPEADRQRIRGRAMFMASWLSQSGQPEAAAVCRDFAMSIDVIPTDAAEGWSTVAEKEEVSP